MAEITGDDLKKSIAMANTDLKKSMKEYLSATDRFSTRLKASMSEASAQHNEDPNA